MSRREPVAANVIPLRLPCPDQETEFEAVTGYRGDGCPTCGGTWCHVSIINVRPYVAMANTS